MSFQLGSLIMWLRFVILSVIIKSLILYKWNGDDQMSVFKFFMMAVKIPECFT